MSDHGLDPSQSNPLAGLDEWESFLQERYPQPREASSFRDYGTNVRPTVREFYRLNHRYQTLDFVLAKERQYLAKDHREMGIWEAMEFLNTLVDDSDPDTDLTQIEHLMQTAEAIRAAGHPRWFVLTGLIHDLGKILCLFGEPQWAVVGDTFPVGCRYSEKIVFSEFFQDNPDSDHPRLPDRVWDLRAGLRAGPRPSVVGPRRVPLSRRQGSSAGRRPGHDPLPLLLRRPPRRSLHPSDERRRPATNGVGPRIQPLSTSTRKATNRPTWMPCGPITKI